MSQMWTLTLPSMQTIQYRAPRKFHLPKRLMEEGLKNYELHSIAAALTLVERTNKCFFDIGANIGVFSLSVSSALSRRCYAFEPFPEARCVLETIVGEYGFPISVSPKGVADKPGQAQLYLSARSDMSNSLDPNFRKHTGTLDVDITTIDEAARVDVPGVLKIDTERAEIAVVSGGMETFRNHNPSIVIEVLNNEIGRELLSMLRPLGYMAYEVSARPGFEPIGDELPALTRNRNWVFTRRPLDAAFKDNLNKWRGLICAIQHDVPLMVERPIASPKVAAAPAEQASSRGNKGAKAARLAARARAASGEAL